MSDCVTLHKHVFITSVTASTDSAWIPVDWKYHGIQQRAVSGFKVATSADSVDVLLRTTVTAADGLTYSVISTATSWGASVTNFSAVIQGPFEEIKVRKIGSSGAATVIGII